MARHLVLLGGFTLTEGGAPVEVPGAVQRLVAWLALRGRAHRVTVAGVLWPDHPEARAMANLRNAVWRLHRVAPGLVDSHREWLALADDVEVDVVELSTPRARPTTASPTLGTRSRSPTATCSRGGSTSGWSSTVSGCGSFVCTCSSSERLG